MFLMQYEPELFPGLVYRMIDPKVVLLIFVSGKVVLTGLSFLKMQMVSSHAQRSDFYICYFCVNVFFRGKGMLKSCLLN